MELPINEKKGFQRQQELSDRWEEKQIKKTRFRYSMKSKI